MAIGSKKVKLTFANWDAAAALKLSEVVAAAGDFEAVAAGAAATAPALTFGALAGGADTLPAAGVTTWAGCALATLGVGVTEALGAAVVLAGPAAAGAAADGDGLTTTGATGAAALAPAVFVFFLLELVPVFDFMIQVLVEFPIGV